MSLLFDRKLIVAVGDSVGGIVFDGSFKINGSVKRDIRASEPDSLDINFKNLSSQSRSLLNTHGMKITVKAGYGDATSVIFVGDIQSCESIRNGTEWNTHVIAGDGAKAIAQSKLSKTYKDGTKLKDILEDAAASMGTTLNMVQADFQDKKIKKSKVVQKQTRAHLDQMKMAYDFDWSIQNGAMIILPRGKSTNIEPYLISAKTGMIGGVEFFNEGGSKDTVKEGSGIGVKGKSLMLPDLTPGMKIVVESPSLEGEIGSHVFIVQGEKKVQGLYTVRNLQHTFDTDRSGGSFETSFEGII